MIYKSGLYRLSPAAWEDGGRTFKGLLIAGSASYTPDINDAFVTDVAGSELVAVGYARATLSTRVASWDAVNDRWRYQCSSPTFGTPAAGPTAASLVVYEEITDDTDSPLVLCNIFTAPVATDGTTFTVTVTSEGVARTADHTA